MFLPACMSRYPWVTSSSEYVRVISSSSFRNNLRRLGWSEADLEQVSEELIDALVARTPSTGSRQMATRHASPAAQITIRRTPRAGARHEMPITAPSVAGTVSTGSRGTRPLRMPSRYSGRTAVATSTAGRRAEPTSAAPRGRASGRGVGTPASCRRGRPAHPQVTDGTSPGQRPAPALSSRPGRAPVSVSSRRVTVPATRVAR